MFSFGVCKLDDYLPDTSRPFGRSRARLRRNRISMQFLRTGADPSPLELSVFEDIVRVLPLGNRTYRTTWRGRFAALDPIVNGWLRRRHRRDAALQVCDWAASDCLTSMEWAASLFADFPNASLVASDLMLFLVELADADGTSVILDREGHPLQVVRPPFVVKLQPPESWWLLPVNRLVGMRALARFGARKPEIPKWWLDCDDETLSIPPFVARKLPLIHPQARSLAERDRRFSICRHSAFEPLEIPVDVIRTMNIFNRSYFSVERLMEGTRAVASSLRTGGCWIVGRTVDATQNTVSVLEKTDRGFRVLERINGGSEIEDLALAHIAD